MNNGTVNFEVILIKSVGRPFSIGRPRFGSHNKMKLKWSQVCNSRPLYKTRIFDLGFSQQKKDQIKRNSSMRKGSKSKLLTRLKIQYFKKDSINIVISITIITSKGIKLIQKQDFKKVFTRSESWSAIIRTLCLTVRRSIRKSNAGCNTEINKSTEEYLHQAVLGLHIKPETEKKKKNPNHQTKTPNHSSFL